MNENDFLTQVNDLKKQMEEKERAMCDEFSEYKNGVKESIFILCRPPGHHSDNINPSGFCLVNNMYFAVDYLRKYMKTGKIVIIDWDVHHGNGTQKLFYDDKSTLFIDLHRDNFYPYTGKKEETGYGYTINIPLEKGSNEDIYINCFNNIIIPSIEKFNPDWIMVSCGFDAHKNDPIGGMLLESTSYGKFHNLIKNLNKPITYLLEGGYNTNSIMESILEMQKADFNTE